MKGWGDESRDRRVVPCSLTFKQPSRLFDFSFLTQLFAFSAMDSKRQSSFRQINEAAAAHKDVMWAHTEMESGNRNRKWTGTATDNRISSERTSDTFAHLFPDMVVLLGYVYSN